MNKNKNKKNKMFHFKKWKAGKEKRFFILKNELLEEKIKKYHFKKWKAGTIKKFFKLKNDGPGIQEKNFFIFLKKGLTRGF